MHDGLVTLFEVEPEIERTAVISTSGTYRYRLGRRWGPGHPMVFVMLNPSKADAYIDDNTIVKCMKFARREGCDGIDVVNLFALRARDPKDLVSAPDPVGPDNDEHLSEAIARAQVLVAGWGTWPAERSLARYGRPSRTIQIALEHDRPLSCLRVTKDGHPGHPLYLPDAAPLAPWPRAERSE